MTHAAAPARARRVLMLSPHFPPDTGAATHRVRLLAPHLPAFGWEPTVVTVDPRHYETRLDPDLCALLPSDLRVVRAPAWPARWTRRAGFGDLGLRAMRGLYATASALLARERFDATFITIFPLYPALLGPLFKRRFGVPLVLDYIDPWVSAWGLTVGGAPDGGPDLRSRLSRRAALRLEPLAVRAADALTAVSAATYDMVLERNPDQRHKPCAEIPYGSEAADYAYLRRHPRQNPHFDPTDGCCHVCYTGTILPLGFETLRAVLGGAGRLRERRPELYARLRLHFFGTSNQTAPDSPARVLPVARELGVEGCVREVPPRIDYLDALTVQTQASAILMLGSSERHYTASKLYPGLLSERPILAVYHAESTVTSILRRAARPPVAQLVTYDDTARAESRTDDICAALAALVEGVPYDPSLVDAESLAPYTARALAGRLAAVFDSVASAAR